MNFGLAKCLMDGYCVHLNYRPDCHKNEIAAVAVVVCVGAYS